MINTGDIAIKLIGSSEGDLHDIEHFMKVWAYAKTIGEKELTGEKERALLETAALLHDIACPLCRVKYGSTRGDLQEKESAALVQEFMREFKTDESFVGELVHIISHHHSNIEAGVVHRILMEADFLVNACESSYNLEQIKSARAKLFKTDTGKKLLDEIYLNKQSKPMA